MINEIINNDTITQKTQKYISIISRNNELVSDIFNGIHIKGVNDFGTERVDVTDTNISIALPDNVIVSDVIDSYKDFVNSSITSHFIKEDIVKALNSAFMFTSSGHVLYIRRKH